MALVSLLQWTTRRRSHQQSIHGDKNRRGVMQTKLLLVTLISSAAFLSGCPLAKYSGDGVLVDNGSGAATDRHVLDLGQIDLTRRHRKTFRLAGLPKSNFVVGLEIRAAADAAVSGAGSINPIVSLTLSDASGTVLFSKRAPLGSWTWSLLSPEDIAFVYGREGPSTYFDAATDVEYTLVLDVIEPDRSGSKYTSALRAKSAGWK